MRTHQDWCLAIEPDVLLDATIRTLTPRKKRLVGCAFAREVADLWRDKRAFQAVRAAEQFADGAIDARALAYAHNLINSSLAQCDRNDKAMYFARCAAWNTTLHEDPLPPTVQGNVREALRLAHGSAQDEARAREVLIIRDIVASPFDAAEEELGRLAGGNVELRQEAERVYAERAFNEVAGLAALLRAHGVPGSIGAQHLESRIEHHLGCWCVDALIGHSSFASEQ